MGANIIKGKETVFICRKCKHIFCKKKKLFPLNIFVICPKCKSFKVSKFIE